MGPTAAGKTAIAMELAGRFSCELISVDSAQVYRGMVYCTTQSDLPAYELMNGKTVQPTYVKQEFVTP